MISFLNMFSWLMLCTLDIMLHGAFWLLIYDCYCFQRESITCIIFCKFNYFLFLHVNQFLHFWNSIFSALQKMWPCSFGRVFVNSCRIPRCSIRSKFTKRARTRSLIKANTPVNPSAMGVFRRGETVREGVAWRLIFSIFESVHL